MRPTIYLWRDLPQFGDVIFKETRDENKIKTNVIYLERLENLNSYVPQEIISDLTDEQIAKLYNIDYENTMKVDNNSGSSWTVHVNGEKWSEKGIINNNK